ncbi:PAS domain S-box protein [Bacillus sp. FJAT-27264]|uniref:bifunctional diguanylate cyclase/phosphodiesterase n=1 Tax=Paenibacillus sp. (strain DSM 101736 / FJAT-27264) TaxID=1850362 RepID=UPI000807BD34|nr:bifunctional diguanylate cyclase/phosphodiesterase [Bacillus sp. FJAT-27264]OBZ08875.1 PAS domain S-box protein [Bacillus sp. FJAT-27264]
MNHIHSSHDYMLVTISYLIAVAASFNVLDLAEGINNTKGRRRWLWHFFGSIVMGMGIWSMHFVGMMSMKLPFPVYYDLSVVLLSVAVGVVASFVALLILGRRKLSMGQLLGGASLFAFGISAMHYIGMYAMQVNISYNIGYVALSILVAFVASITALWLSLYFVQQGRRSSFIKKFGSALIMGAAIAGMHYTGMLAAHYETETSADRMLSPLSQILDQTKLGYIIAAGTLFTLGLSLIGLYISRLFSKQALEKQENEKWYRSLYEHNQDGIVSIDLHRKIIGINPAAARITGVREKEFRNRPALSLLTLVVEEEQERIREFFLRTIDGEAVRYETVLRRGSQDRIHVSVVLAPVIVDEQVVGSYIILRDITEEKRAEEKHLYLAFHDELTGLPNRRKFNQTLSEMIEARSQDQKPFAVMVMDIDRFKIINDSLGHIYGDLFLQEVSSRILRIVDSEQAMLARMGGDEFAVLFYPDTDVENSAVLADKIIQEMGQPYYLKDNEFYVTASIGIALFPEHGQDVVQLLKNADTAMYEVKKNGKNGHQFYSVELYTVLQERMELEADLRKALERKELVLYYQPQIRTGDVHMVGVEALVRWNHPVHGLLSPDVFISLAEETGLIMELGNQVLYEACRQMHEWHQAGGPVVPVAVNLSSQQFHQPNLVEQIKQILSETGLSPQYLELEITESMMMDAKLSFDILNQLTEYGIRISLDDFGTGYSSFSYLKMFPIHKVKIDRSFIQDLAVNSNDKAIVSTIITMARQLNMDVIAEGIETRAQLDILTEQDCNEVQGYFYSRPLSANDVEQLFFVPSRAGAE